MQSIVSKVAFRGIETLDVSVQVHMSNGLPAMAIVGLADKAVAESISGCPFLSGAGIAGQTDSGKSIPGRFTQGRGLFRIVDCDGLVHRHGGVAI